MSAKQVLKTVVTCAREVDKLFTIGTLFDLKYCKSALRSLVWPPKPPLLQRALNVGAHVDPVEVEAFDVALELKTPVTETKFIPFPNEATFADCPGKSSICRFDIPLALHNHSVHYSSG